MIDSNFWFYTLSAIPQTIASLIALSATFVVFKINSINSGIDTDVYHIKIFLNTLNNNFEPYILRTNLKNILEPLENEINKLDLEKKYLGLDYEVFDNLTSACRYIISGQTVSWYPLNEKNLYKFITYKKDSLKNAENGRNKIFDYLKKVLWLSGVSVTLCLFSLPHFKSTYLFLNIDYTEGVVYSVSIFSVLSIIYIIYSIFRIAEIKNN